MGWQNVHWSPSESFLTHDGLDTALGNSLAGEPPPLAKAVGHLKNLVRWQIAQTAFRSFRPALPGPAHDWPSICQTKKGCLLLIGCHPDSEIVAIVNAITAPQSLLPSAHRERAASSVLTDRKLTEGLWLSYPRPRSDRFLATSSRASEKRPSVRYICFVGFEHKDCCIGTLRSHEKPSHHEVIMHSNHTHLMTLDAEQSC